jgi:hypothetical protein
MISLLTEPKGAASPQLQFDWEIGHARPWLKISEVARALKCSNEQVVNLFDAREIDVAINIGADDARRPAYRVYRASFDRLVRGTRNAPKTDLETGLQADFKRLSTVLAAWQAADYLRCTDRHILTLGHYFTDIGAGQDRRYLRIHRMALFAFITKRRIS